MAKVLTAKAVEAAQADARRREIPDAQLPGLYLVVQPSGAKSWALRYRIAGAPKKLTIGPVLLSRSEDAARATPALGQPMTLPEARAAARAALQTLSEGRDPSAAKKAAKALPVDPERDLVRTLSETFVERWCKPRNRTWGEVERQFKVEINPGWGERRVQDIARRDIIELLDSIVSRGSPVTANRVLATLSKFFNWLVDRDVIASSPCTGVGRPAPESPRDRVLADDELRLVWLAADRLGEPFAPIVKLLILTGQRREEVGGMTWRELSLEGDAVWNLPAERTKNGLAHAVPLSPQSLVVIKSVKRKAGRKNLLFTTTGETPVSGFSRAKMRLDALMLDIAQAEAQHRGDDPSKVAPVPPWTLHDLRRTAASGMARLNINLPVIEKILNHVSGSFAGIVGVYQRHEFAAEKRAALGAWGNFVETLVGDKRTGNVAQLRRSR